MTGFKIRAQCSRRLFDGVSAIFPTMRHDQRLVGHQLLCSAAAGNIASTTIPDFSVAKESAPTVDAADRTARLILNENLGHVEAVISTAKVKFIFADLLEPTAFELGQDLQ